MTDDEAERLFAALIHVLRQRRDVEQPSERDNYLAAIETEIDAGKPVAVKLKVRDEKTVSDPVTGTRAAGSSSSADFIQRQEYSGLEKLKILLNGLGLATIAPGEMALRLTTSLRSLGEQSHFKSVKFGNDQTSEHTRVMTLPTMGASFDAMGNLKELFDEIGRELEN